MYSLLGEQSPTARLAPKICEPRVGAVHRDAEGQRDVAFEAGGVVRDQVAALPVRDHRGDLCEHPRSARSFSLNGRGDESSTDTRVNRAMAWLGITPGSSAR